MCVPDDRAHAAVEKAAHRDFFARGLRVHVHENDARLLPQTFDFGLHDEERIFQRRLHEGAALHVDDGDFPFRRIENDAATAGRGGRVVQRAQQARLHVEMWDDFLLVPNVVAARDDRDFCAEQVGANLRRDAAPVRGVLAVHNDEINSTLIAPAGNRLDHSPAARLADDIAKKK